MAGGSSYGVVGAFTMVHDGAPDLRHPATAPPGAPGQAVTEL
jgi:hypothetical protein